MSEKKFVSTIVWNADKLTNCNNLYEIRETIERLNSTTMAVMHVLIYV